jgi:antitoxin (DNA-binding transcriptional repressor) of toxin-antitoxin stability system
MVIEVDELGENMSVVTIEEAQVRLADLINQLGPGDEVVITRDEKPIARLTTPAKPNPGARRLGTMKGTVLHVAPDFDEPLDDFREYAE